MKNLAIAFALLSLAACSGGPARPQVKEILASDGSKVQMEYVADKLSTVRSVDNKGTVTSTATAVYENAQLKNFVIVSGNSSQTYVYAYDEASRLKSIDMTSGSSTYSYDATYSQGRISRTESAIVGNGVSITTVTDYTYSDAGQIKERKNTTTSIWPIIGTTVGTSTETFTYDPATGLLKEVATKSGDSTTLTQLTYDTSSRLWKVVGGGATDTLDYGTDGYVSRATHESNNTITFRAYSYTGGTVMGILANPLVNFGELYDLAGRALPTDQVYVSSAVMGLE